MSILMTRRGLTVLVAVAALCVGALAAASQAQAATIFACVKKNGTARVFSKKPKCKKGESLVSWANVGPAGKNGVNGANGTNGTNGSNGKNGTNGLEGAAGQPQKAVSFNASLAAPFLSNEDQTLFSLAGVTARLNCANALIADVSSLEATGPSGSTLVSGLTSSKVNDKEATEGFTQPVYDVSLSAANTPFASLVTNGKSPIGNVGHVDATIVTSSAVVLVQSFLEVNEGSTNCKATGVALTIPL